MEDQETTKNETPPNSDESKADEQKPVENNNTAENAEKQENKGIAEMVNDIKAQYEAKIAKLNEDHKKEINERNDVIKQLLNGESTEAPLTIADKINQRRNFKKW